MQPTPLAIVRADGKVEELGAWHPKERLLELFVPGFPFLGPGRHTLESDLPWLLYDMSPSGFMGAQFARQFPELGLPEQPMLWGPEHCLRAISERGEDLSGNLLVGVESRRRFFEQESLSRSGERYDSDLRAMVETMAEATASGGSSVGGDRPKHVLHMVENGQRVDVIAKYSPPLESAAGRRWKNLLAMEALVSECLRNASCRSAVSSFVNVGEGHRAVLLIRRFDRVPPGRIGAATLSWLAASRGEAERSGPEVLKSLHRDGLIDQASVTTAELVHDFSRAIGNTDAHLGNYGLVFDAVGTATLAPIYDVSPMVFAPRHDELPDAWVKPRSTPMRADVVPLVEALVRLARASTALDPDFLDLWLRYVGA